MLSIVLTPKWTFLGRKHVVWAIQRKNRCDGAIWARDRGKNTGQQKNHKRVIFPLFGGSPHWIYSTQKLHGGWCPRRNHVCQVSNRNLHGLRFYRGSNFRFSYWFLHGPSYNSAALMHCLWWWATWCPQAVPIPITPDIKRSIPWFTGYSAVKFHWNMSITFCAVCLAILNPCQDPDSDPDLAQNLTKSCRLPQLSTHKISSTSVNNFFRYSAKIQKSGVNPVSGSEIWSGSGLRPNQIVQTPAAIDA